MSTTHLILLVKKIVLKIAHPKNSILQGQQKKGMKPKNVRKTKSYGKKGKNFKSVKGLQRNFRKCIL